MTFDKAALDFLVKNALGENEELSEYWNDCHNSFRLALAKLKKENPHTDISIEYMDAIFDPNEKPLLLIKNFIERNWHYVIISPRPVIYSVY